MDQPNDGGKTPATKPAITINIASWATPVVGLLMLALGLLGGYFGRPLLGREGGTGETASTIPPAATAAPQTPGQPEIDPATREALMGSVIGQVRHFMGDPNAPVTIIEFSDFQ